MSIPSEPSTPVSGINLPKWLSSSRPNRSRAFIIVKCVLLVCLAVIIIETLAYLPICARVIQNKIDNPPAPETKIATASDVLLFSIIYFSFRILVITVAAIGLFKENSILLLIHACLLPFTVLLIFALFYQATVILLYFSSAWNLVTFIITIHFAILIRRSDP